jgi:hypothetical protein
MNTHALESPGIYGEVINTVTYISDSMNVPSKKHDGPWYVEAEMEQITKPIYLLPQILLFLSWLCL